MSLCQFRNCIAVLSITVLLGGCATAETPRPGSENNTSVVKSCVSNVAKNLRDLDQVNFLVQACLGNAVSKDAQVARTHVTILLLANYGERSIRAFQKDDPEHATADALVLKHRIQKAIKRLEIIRAPGAMNNDERFLRQAFPTYRELSGRPAADVQLYGVVRAALIPAARRTEDAFRSYVRSASGGVAGVFGKLLKRRQTVKKKYRLIRKTLSLGKAAVLDTRCLLNYIDSTKNVGVTRDTDRCPERYPADLNTQLWPRVQEWLKETVDKLDQITNVE